MGFTAVFTWFFLRFFPEKDGYLAYGGCCKARVLSKGAEVRPDPSWWPELGRCHWVLVSYGEKTQLG